MAAKVQVCQKCNTVFARMEVTGGQGWADTSRYSGSTMCPKCHGNVVWKSEDQANDRGKGLFGRR